MHLELQDYEPKCQCRILYHFTCDSYHNLENLYDAQSSSDKWKEQDMPTNAIGKQQGNEKNNLHSVEDFDNKIKNLDTSVEKLLKTHEEVFGSMCTAKLQEADGD